MSAPPADELADREDKTAKISDRPGMPAADRLGAPALGRPADSRAAIAAAVGGCGLEAEEVPGLDAEFSMEDVPPEKLRHETPRSEKLRK